MKNNEKRCRKSTKHRSRTLAFSSFLFDCRRDRPGDAKKHPREHQKTRRERPKRPQGLPRRLPDPPRGGPKLAKRQQREISWCLLGPQGAPGAAQEASGGYFAMMFGPFGLHFAAFRVGFSHFLTACSDIRGAPFFQDVAGHRAQRGNTKHCN